MEIYYQSKVWNKIIIPDDISLEEVRNKLNSI